MPFLDEVSEDDLASLSTPDCGLLMTFDIYTIGEPDGGLKFGHLSPQMANGKLLTLLAEVAQRAQIDVFFETIHPVSPPQADGSPAPTTTTLNGPEVPVLMYRMLLWTDTSEKQVTFFSQLFTTIAGNGAAMEMVRTGRSTDSSYEQEPSAATVERDAENEIDEDEDDEATQKAKNKAHAIKVSHAKNEFYDERSRKRKALGDAQGRVDRTKMRILAMKDSGDTETTVPPSSVLIYNESLFWWHLSHMCRMQSEGDVADYKQQTSTDGFSAILMADPMCWWRSSASHPAKLLAAFIKRYLSWWAATLCDANLDLKAMFPFPINPMQWDRSSYCIQGTLNFQWRADSALTKIPTIMDPTDAVPLSALYLPHIRRSPVFKPFHHDALAAVLDSRASLVSLDTPCNEDQSVHAMLQQNPERVLMPAMACTKNIVKRHLNEARGTPSYSAVWAYLEQRWHRILCKNFITVPHMYQKIPAATNAHNLYFNTATAAEINQLYAAKYATPSECLEAMLRKSFELAGLRRSHHGLCVVVLGGLVTASLNEFGVRPTEELLGAAGGGKTVMATIIFRNLHPDLQASLGDKTEAAELRGSGDALVIQGMTVRIDKAHCCAVLMDEQNAGTNAGQQSANTSHGPNLEARNWTRKGMMTLCKDGKTWAPADMILVFGCTRVITSNEPSCGPIASRRNHTDVANTDTDDDILVSAFNTLEKGGLKADVLGLQHHVAELSLFASSAFIAMSQGLLDHYNVDLSVFVACVCDMFYMKKHPGLRDFYHNRATTRFNLTIEGLHAWKMAILFRVYNFASYMGPHVTTFDINLFMQCQPVDGSSIAIAITGRNANLASGHSEICTDVLNALKPFVCRDGSTMQVRRYMGNDVVPMNIDSTFMLANVMKARFYVEKLHTQVDEALKKLQAGNPIISKYGHKQVCVKLSALNSVETVYEQEIIAALLTGIRSLQLDHGQLLPTFVCRGETYVHITAKVDLDVIFATMPPGAMAHCCWDALRALHDTKDQEYAKSLSDIILSERIGGFLFRDDQPVNAMEEPVRCDIPRPSVQPVYTAAELEKTPADYAALRACDQAAHDLRTAHITFPNPDGVARLSPEHQTLYYNMEQAMIHRLALQRRIGSLTRGVWVKETLLHTQHSGGKAVTRVQDHTNVYACIVSTKPNEMFPNLARPDGKLRYPSHPIPFPTGATDINGAPVLRDLVYISKVMPMDINTHGARLPLLPMSIYQYNQFATLAVYRLGLDDLLAIIMYTHTMRTVPPMQWILPSFVVHVTSTKSDDDYEPIVPRWDAQMMTEELELPKDAISTHQIASNLAAYAKHHKQSLPAYLRGYVTRGLDVDEDQWEQCVKKWDGVRRARFERLE